MPEFLHHKMLMRDKMSATLMKITSVAENIPHHGIRGYRGEETSQPDGLAQLSTYFVTHAVGGVAGFSNVATMWMISTDGPVTNNCSATLSCFRPHCHGFAERTSDASACAPCRPLRAVRVWSVSGNSLRRRWQLPVCADHSVRRLNIHTTRPSLRFLPSGSIVWCCEICKT